jgi:outer membrane receptor protein involved in Fe transport
MEIQENYDFDQRTGFVGSGVRSGARFELGFSEGPLRVWGGGAQEEEEADSGHALFLDSGGVNLLDPGAEQAGLENPRTTIEVGGGAGFEALEGRVTAHVAARRLDHGDWADAGTAWQAAAAGSPVDDLRLRFSLARGQRPPRFSEQSLLRQIADDLGEIHPGRVADPGALETWLEARAEAEWNGAGWRVAGRVWSADADGAFVWLPPTVWLAFDRAETSIRLGDVGFNSFDVLDLSASGAEGEVELPLPWRLKGRLVGRRLSVEDDRLGEQVPYVPRTQILGQLRYADRFFPSRDLLLEARLTGRYTGDRMTLGGETLSSFLVTDLLLQGTIIDFTIFVSLKNLGGQRYRSEESFFLPGREGYFGVNWRFRN